MLSTQFFAMKLRRVHGPIWDNSIGACPRRRESFLQRLSRRTRLARTPVDIETIANSERVNDPLTKYMFCSPAEGGAALILCNEKTARELAGPSCG